MDEPPGYLVNVQLLAGNPDKTTPPVATAHVDCVIVPTMGADCTGRGLITTFADDAELHPEALVTINV